MFIDQARIEVESGRGGKGCVSFRKEKYVPFGGPDGGDGGRGGHVFLQATKSLLTLLDIHQRRFYKAGNGQSGSGNNRHGKDGADLILYLPLGTQVFDSQTRELLVDLIEDKQQIMVVRGGKGGQGNARFASSTNQAPRYAQPGEESSKKILNLELKLIAQVGLIGYPNVGKSTLLSKISRAHPKIADYPFTTLYPNLGVVKLNELETVVVADIPGLIRGAHQGIGLGDRFLRHIERTKLLVHILEPSLDAIERFQIINQEMSSYSQQLIERPQIIVVNKMDLEGSIELFDRLKDKLAELGFEPLPISALTGEGVEELINRIASRLKGLL